MRLGDLVKFKRSKSHTYRTPEPLGMIIKTWSPSVAGAPTSPSGTARARPPSKCLVEWLIHPGSPSWYRREELVLVSSAE